MSTFKGLQIPQANIDSLVYFRRNPQAPITNKGTVGDYDVTPTRTKEFINNSNMINYKVNFYEQNRRMTLPIHN